MKITAERAREVFDYDLDRGVFFRKEARSNQPSGKETRGWPTGAYLALTIDYQQIKAHILAWLLVTGGYPPAFLDHINRDKHDNRWNNLRLATQTLNNMNIGRRADNKSGLRGISWDTKNKKWAARLKVGGKYLFLGYFHDKGEAGEVYRQSALAHYGAFAEGVHAP